MSAELFDMIKWCLILLVASLAYEPAGKFVNSFLPSLGLLWSFILIYFFIIMTILALFGMSRHYIADKLVGRDFFGGSEFYLGMVAGAFRYTCIVLVFMSFLNARYYTPQEIAASEKFQNDNFETIRFPTLHSTQKEVFQQALSGRVVQKYLYVLLIKPTSPQDNGKNSEKVSPKNRRAFDDVIDKKR